MRETRPASHPQSVIINELRTTSCVAPTPLLFIFIVLPTIMWTTLLVYMGAEQEEDLVVVIDTPIFLLGSLL